MISIGDNGKVLFRHREIALSEFLASLREQAQDTIDGMPDADVIAQGVSELALIYQRHAACEAPEILHDRIGRSGESETYLHRVTSEYDGRPLRRERRMKLRLRIPLKGNRNLLLYQPPASDGHSVRVALLREEWIEFVLDVLQDESKESIELEAREHVERIRSHIEWGRPEVERHNERVVASALAVANQRYDQAMKARELVASLNFPLYRDSEAIEQLVPVRPRVVVPSRPPTSPFADERVISESDYEAVLTYLAMMRSVIERHPKIFAHINEEQGRTREEIIRDFFLIMLNTGFHGGATGETFNCTGKTDILVRSGDRNVFIGECKFWDGDTRFTEGVDQLLGYPAWRDTKAGYLLFIRRKAVSAAIRSAKEALWAHRNTISKGQYQSDERIDVVMRSKLDPERHIKVALLPYAIPVA